MSHYAHFMSFQPESALVDDKVPAVHLLDGGGVLVLELVEEEPPQDGGLANPLRPHHNQLCTIFLPKHVKRSCVHCSRGEGSVDHF